MCCQTPLHLFLLFTVELSMFWGQCQLCLLIQVVFPVILSSRCKHLQLFTVKCPLCSPSLPVCFQHYATCCTYCMVSPYCSIQQWEVIGRVTCEVIVSREKINADWSRHDSLPEARATEAPAKASFFKRERGLFNSCISSQAGRQWRGKEGQKKANAKQRGLSKWEPQNGTLFKGLKSIEQKVQTHAMLIYRA